MYIGVDGCVDGWVTVCYDNEGYTETLLYEDIEVLWDDHGESAETILIDIPIGLREDSSAKRPCDDLARGKLSPNRHTSVFPVPVRDAVYAESYEAAKAVQERKTDGSLGVQSWNIADKIAQLDAFLRETDPDAVGVIREAHPEVCFWAFNDEVATGYSKTSQPAAAFWERVAILEAVDSGVVAHVRDAGRDLDGEVGNDDIADAFALALTASQKTGTLQKLPEEWPMDDEGDPTGELPMEMVYAFSTA